MPKLTSTQRSRLPKQDFAVRSKAPGPAIPDAAHAKAAIGLAAMHGDADAEEKARALSKRKGLIRSVND